MILRVFLVAMATLLASAGAHADKRVALVIGNGAYLKAGALTNPIRDAMLIADSLIKAGFEERNVVTVQNGTYAEMRRNLRRFKDMTTDADIAVVYFSGHGLQVGGSNYLLPVNAELAHRDSLDDEAIGLAEVQDAVKTARRLKLIILDACRDNPFASAFAQASAKGAGRKDGLAETSSAGMTNLLVAFAAAPGQFAYDGDGGNSAYASSLATHIPEPGLDVLALMRRVHDDVVTEGLKTGKYQEPFKTDSLGREEVYLSAKAKEPPPPQAAPLDARIQRDFTNAQALKSIAVWDQFLEDYKATPGNYFVVAGREARDRLVAALKPQSTPPDPMQAGQKLQYGIVFSPGLSTEQIFAQINTDQRLSGKVTAVPEEGTILPNTYVFAQDYSRDKLVADLRDVQLREVKTVWDGRQDGLPLATTRDLIILASIVEKETAKPDERSRIAGVLINRLRRNMRLETDSSIIYGLYGGQSWIMPRVLTRAELAAPNPYNTFKINGLPPGPISNPSRGALEAVANPMPTNELFYIADGTGSHLFAATLAEHNKNVIQVRAAEAQRNSAKAKPQPQ